MNILDRIVADKHREVALRKKLFPEAYWEQSPLFDRSTVSLKNNLQNKIYFKNLLNEVINNYAG